MAGKATLTIDVTATTSGAVSGLDKAKLAVKDYGDAADTATKQSRDVSGAIDSVGGTAGKATTGLRDMSDAVAMAGFPELAAGMQVAAVGLESLDGAATLYAAAQEGLSKAVAFFDGILKALKLTILTNPIFIIAAVVIAIGAAFVVAYMKCETFRNIVDGAVRVVWSTIQTVYNWVKDNWPLLLTILTGPFGLMVAVIVKHRDSIWDAIKAVYNWIRDTWDAVSGFLSAPIKAAWDTIKGIVDKITGAIQDVLDLIGKIKIPKGVTDFIGAVNPFAVVPGGASPTMFAAPSVAGRATTSSSSSSSGGVTINVTGALDPDAVARQIDRILSGRSRRVGGVNRRAGTVTP
jgi:phage-related protein